ncbi:hypothetical protein Q4F19_04515 [Sphingomonas sp. BIUV-7]|uniref:Uncharacterized protein n=1 Tax=Sphingomonas natans TaxID=3063330 RepID=A0ABT8Y6V7_9SPHN|nr:hypothetical protein [Sphingomonas sp. BIUV-7]MDO6413638.1 hypothetical protein [Sphingomonas sp. BIUV-7]
MPTQSFSDDHRFQGFFLNLAERDAKMAGKWRRSSRLLFCMASAIASWLIFVSLAEIMIGR